MKTIMIDPFLGEREINSNLALIEDQLKLLAHFRDTRANPSLHLLTDIKVYEYILKHAEPGKMASLYLDEADRMRREQKTFSIKKEEVAKNLGWNI